MTMAYFVGFLFGFLAGGFIASGEHRPQTPESKTARRPRVARRG
jgi:hypothetical protein